MPEKIKWVRCQYGFAYTAEFHMGMNEEVILRMPDVTPNKRGVNDIGWQADGDVVIYATLSDEASKTRLWQEISPYDEINKTISYLKVVSTGEAHVCIKVILN